MRELLERGLALPPKERVALARELVLSATADDPSLANEVGAPPALVYDWAYSLGVPAPGMPARPPASSAAEAGHGKVAFTLEFWQDEGWYVGRLREVPGVFSQGETLPELEDNIRDAYGLVLSDLLSAPPAPDSFRKRIEVEA